MVTIGSFWHKPQAVQDFLSCFHKSAGKDASPRTGVFSQRIRCLPIHLRHSEHKNREEAVRKLTADVELLSELPLFNNPENSPKAVEGTDSENLRLSVSEDVHMQIQKIFALVKELAANGDNDSKSPTSQRQTLVPESETELVEDMLANDIPVMLLAELPLLEFEVRKEVMNLCCALLWSTMPTELEDHVLEYLRKHPRLFDLLTDGYKCDETALHYGVVLRSCARHARLVDAFLKSGRIFDLIDYTKMPSIDISSDAFYTLKEFLLNHKEVSAPWLNEHCSEFFSKFNDLLKSEDYLVGRQALMLLGDLLLDRAFKKVTLEYVNNEQNLMIAMNLLKDSSMVIQVEAFNVFKVFVANPNKSERVQKILFKNKDKLVKHLETLHSNKPDDQKFNEEQRKVIEKLRPLSPPRGTKTSM